MKHHDGSIFIVANNLQTVLALPFFGYELFRSLFGEKINARSHLSLGLIIGFDVILFLSFVGAVTMGLILSVWGWGIDMGLNFTLLAVA